MKMKVTIYTPLLQNKNSESKLLLKRGCPKAASFFFITLLKNLKFEPVKFAIK